MPTREEMIAELSKGQGSASQRAPSREEMIAELSGVAKPQKGTFSKVLDGLNYGGRVLRTAVAAPFTDKVEFEDVADQAKHLYPENAAKKAPSGKELNAIVGQAIQLPVLGATADYKGPKSVGLDDAVFGKNKVGLSELPDGKLIENDGLRSLAGLVTETGVDPLNLIPLLPMSKMAKGLKSLVTAEKVVKNVEDGATAAQNIVKIGSNAETGLNALDAIKLANEGGQKLSAQKITEAAKRLGFEPTKGMITNNPTIKGLESSLEQSPSVAGALVRHQTDKVRSGITKAVGELTKDTTSYSKFELGEQIKSGIMEKIAQRHAPIAEQFNKLRESTAFIDVPEKSKLTLAQNFMKHPDVALAPNSSWGSKAQQFGDYLLNAKSADDIKRLRTIVGKEIKASANPNEQRVLSSIYGSLTRLEENTIKRAAISTARTSKEGAQVGRQMIGELRQAKQGYKGLMTDIADVSKAGSFKKSHSIEDFLDLVDNVPSEQIGERLFKTNDLKSLSIIEKQFPNEFSLMRQQKVTDLVNKSLIKGQLDAGKLTKAVKDMGPEVIKKIFGGKADAVLKDVQTVLDARPNMMGPSGTPQGQMFMNMIDLPFQGKEMLRFGAYKKLQNPTIPLEQIVRGTIPFKKAGQVSTGGLSDLIGVTNKAKMGINAVRSINEPQK